MREGSVSREGPLGAPSGRLGLAEPAGPGVSPNASSATAELFPVRNHGVELVTPEGGSRDRLLSVAQFIDAICFHYFSRRHRCLYSLGISAEGTMQKMP